MTHTTPQRTVLKRCACGATYDATAWEELPLVGVVGDDAFGRESVFEIRQCACQSSIAIRRARGEGA